MNEYIYIICEYSPIHRGHYYMISEARKLHPHAIVIAIMSGHFSQRGTPSIVDKFTRAKAAVACGVDLVVSLPFPWSCSSAEYFATSGVYIANEIAEAIRADLPESKHTLAFGSESGDLDGLILSAKRLMNPYFLTTHSPREKAKLYEMLYGGGNAILRRSNDILGIEYIRAIIKSNSILSPLAIKRFGMGHDEKSDSIKNGIIKGFASSSYIRELIHKNEFDIAAGHIPVDARQIILDALNESGPTDISYASNAFLAALRSMDPKEMPTYAECSSGLGGRLYKAAHDASTYEDVLFITSAKSFTFSRLRRAVLYAVCGIHPADLKTMPKYTQLLAASRRGRSILRYLKKIEKINVLTKPADYKKMSAEASEQCERERRSDAYFTLCYSPALSSGSFIKKSPDVEK